MCVGGGRREGGRGTCVWEGRWRRGREEREGEIVIVVRLIFSETGIFTPQLVNLFL
jgi:hypothetical protein